MARLIALEGIDGSGKGTQAGLLHERLQRAGKTCTLLSFPRYEHTLFGKAVGDYLNGRFGTLDEVSPFLVSLLYAGDRYESRRVLADALASSDVVILDRYVASNVAHQGAKATGAERAELIAWIERIEFEIFSLPRPDLVVLLDIPADTAQRLIAKKNARTYTDRKADLQEADGAYLERVREVYLELAAANPSWRRVDCVHGGMLRSVDEIADEIAGVVSAVL